MSDVLVVAWRGVVAVVLVVVWLLLWWLVGDAGRHKSMLLCWPCALLPVAAIILRCSLLTLACVPVCMFLLCAHSGAEDQVP